MVPQEDKFNVVRRSHPDAFVKNLDGERASWLSFAEARAFIERLPEGYAIWKVYNEDSSKL